MSILTVGKYYCWSSTHWSLTNARYEFPAGGPDAAEKGLHAKLRPIDDAFLVRLCTIVALGFAGANIFGDVVCEDLISSFLQVSSAQPLVSPYLSI